MWYKHDTLDDLWQLWNNVSKEILMNTQRQYNEIEEIDESYHRVAMVGKHLIVDGIFYEPVNTDDRLYDDLVYVRYMGYIWVQE